VAGVTAALLVPHLETVALELPIQVEAAAALTMQLLVLAAPAS
jgi:hypothetical protein